MQTKPLTVAISGGIGSGKTVVSEILSTFGYKVFNCDAEAKSLMDIDAEIKRRIARDISDKAILHDGRIDRAALSAIVFTDKEKLIVLNNIVHGAVKQRISEWIGRNNRDSVLFIETALLYQSGIDRMVDKVLEVAAPEKLRIERVMRRNSLSESEVIDRINSQKITIDFPHADICVIDNSGCTPLLPQIQDFLEKIESGRSQDKA